MPHLLRLARAVAIATIGQIGLLGLLGPATPAAGGESDLPRLVPHQSFVEDVLRGGELPIADPQAMFAWVFSTLPDRVKVYPTESYWYFSFIHQGVRFAGNIRLDAKDRDDGKIHFAYFEDLSEWREEPPMNYVVLDEAEGVKLEKVEPFLYRMTRADKSVLFELNDLRAVVPPPGAVLAGEVYLGPIFDDSAVRFFLIYNPQARVFHYVLDETVPPTEGFLGMRENDRTLIGKRTGFAYYRDHRSERKILVGVFEGNARVNNAYDGPFDQLPDGFIVGESLRNAILEVAPELKGKIDRYGGLADGSGRYLIAPYAYYRGADDLLAFHACATDAKVPKAYYPLCFAMNWAGEGEISAYVRMRDDAKAAAPPHRPAAKPKKH